MDDGGSQYSWIFTVLILLCLAMYFAMTETAYASVSRAHVKMLADKGDSRAKKALDIVNRFETAITTLLICTNIVHIAAASVVTINVTRLWGVSYVTLSTLLTTLVVFFFGEMLPKSIARKYNERLTLMTADSLAFLMFILKPLSSLLTLIGNGAAKLTKGEPEVSVTEGELYDIIEDLTREGSLDEEQGELISSALQFRDVEVSSILTSRIDMVAIDVDMPQDEVLQLIKNSNHSRLPVYEGSTDHIIGVLQIRKYIRTYLQDGEIKDMRPLLDTPYFVYQSTKIDDLLPAMSKEKMNLAVVIDNYGGTLGIVTVEDIVEELVGEIWDEDDSAEVDFVKVDGSTYSVKASDVVADVLEELDIPCPGDREEEFANKRMSELAMEAFTEIPHEGDTFHFLNTQITIQTMQENRIIRLLVRIEQEEKEGEQA